MAWEYYTDYFSCIFFAETNAAQFNMAQGYCFQNCATASVIVDHCPWFPKYLL